MTGFTSGMRTSLTDDWATPQGLFDQLNEEFDFTLDVCASATNCKVSRFFDVNADGLKQDWTKDVCWMNPPYGRVIGQWVKKAYDTGLGGGTVVCLLPARTDTKWWRDYVMRASELRFIKGRVKFGNSNVGAPFPSVIVIYGTPTTPRITMFEARS
ncbi:DNA N-6-adenine-methyltransferase [Methanomassiliicoccales archaeon LGM-RCC1]|nr:DNA N-6-adenine-methyltransferase [Methanomassiliicoccales archaeon LGM-RCC1]